MKQGKQTISTNHKRMKNRNRTDTERKRFFPFVPRNSVNASPASLKNDDFFPSIFRRDLSERVRSNSKFLFSFRSMFLERIRDFFRPLYCSFSINSSTLLALSLVKIVFLYNSIWLYRALSFLPFTNPS